MFLHIKLSQMRTKHREDGFLDEIIIKSIDTPIISIARGGFEVAERQRRVRPRSPTGMRMELSYFQYETADDNWN